MNASILPRLLTFYGLFLSLCGIASVIFIGRKAKTALLSGGMSGVIAIYTAWLMGMGNPAARWVGIILSFALFVVFAWRAAKTFLRITELVHTQSTELPGKSTAFLIIALMAVMSIVVFMIQIILL